MEANHQSGIVQLVGNRIKEHGSKHKIEELSLDQIPISTMVPSICSLIQKCKGIQYLSMCDCSLFNLGAMPSLLNLQVLELANNKLQAQNLEPLAKYTKLYELDLQGNAIKDFSWTKYLRRLRVTVIILKGNPISEEIDYREKVFKTLGVDLDILDGVDRGGNAVAASISSESSDEQDYSEDEMKEEERQSDSEPDVSVQLSGQEYGQPSKKVKIEQEPKQSQ